MVNRAAWECVDELCRWIMNIYDKPFGGIPFLGLGDFRQVAPVVSGVGEWPSFAASVKSSQLWKKMCIFTLGTPIRSVDEPKYTYFMDDIGEDFSRERRSLDLIQNISQLADAIDFLFPPHILADPFACLECAFLSPCNAFVDEFNEFVLDTLQVTMNRTSVQTSSKKQMKCLQMPQKKLLIISLCSQIQTLLHTD
ncbi:hypothetical protein M405DRAFT_869273 [Rhizopogon salebrosus TDB-379]|nr:hypothetical protein M405DRAFT_869273 [Rhizopogon salebrosus TDB-379]